MAEVQSHLITSSAPIAAGSRASKTRDQSKAAQAISNHNERTAMNLAQLAQPEFAPRKHNPSSVASLRQSPAMHAEGGRAVKLAQEPKVGFRQATHAPSDTLIIVDSVGDVKASGGRQVVGHETARPSTVQQFANAEIKPQRLLRLPEAGFVHMNHAQPPCNANKLRRSRDAAQPI
jgi:hypothetical protein